MMNKSYLFTSLLIYVPKQQPRDLKILNSQALFPERGNCVQKIQSFSIVATVTMREAALKIHAKPEEKHLKMRTLLLEYPREVLL